MLSFFSYFTTTPFIKMLNKVITHLGRTCSDGADTWGHCRFWGTSGNIRKSPGKVELSTIRATTVWSRIWPITTHRCLILYMHQFPILVTLTFLFDGCRDLRLVIGGVRVGLSQVWQFRGFIVLSLLWCLVPVMRLLIWLTQILLNLVLLLLYHVVTCWVLQFCFDLHVCKKKRLSDV